MLVGACRVDCCCHYASIRLLQLNCLLLTTLHKYGVMNLRPLALQVLVFSILIDRPAFFVSTQMFASTGKRAFFNIKSEAKPHAAPRSTTVDTARQSVSRKCTKHLTGVPRKQGELRLHLRLAPAIPTLALRVYQAV